MLPLSAVTAAINNPAATLPSPATQPATTQPASSAAATQPALPKDIGAEADLNAMGLEDLMHVKVNSVSKIDQNISQAAAAVTVIGQDDIRRSGLTSIPELLRLAPGLEVARINASQWAIGSRGFNGVDSNKLLVLMDGRTVYDPLYAGVQWNMQDYLMADLDKIEVIRGPGATLWGSNAVDGVINITTKSARDTQGGLLDINGGSFDSNAAIRYGGQLAPDTYYRVYGKFDNTMDLLNHPARNDVGNWNGSNGGFRLDKYPDADTTLTLEANTQYDLGSPGPDAAHPGQLLETRHNSMTGSNILGRWTHNDSPESGMSLQLYYDHFGLDDLQNFNYHRDTADLDFQHHFQLANFNEITWGFGFRSQQEVSSLDHPIFFKNGQRDDYIASSFVQDDITLVPRHFHLILGSKFEDSSYSQFQVQPSARLLFTPNEYNTLWVAASRAVRSPAILELAGHTVVNNLSVNGNADLKPEIVRAYEAGYRTQPTEKLTLDLTTFYNQYNQLIALDTSSIMQTGSLTADNEGRAHSYGVELAANYKVNSAWRLAASYTFFNSHLEVSRASISSPGNDPDTSPKNQFQLHSYYDLSRNLDLNTSAYYVDSMPGVRPYIRLDLGVNWRLGKGLELGVTGQNLLQSHHTEFFQQGITQGQEIPRSVLLHLSYAF
jgi:iron complex outermembrane receptor protein